MNRRDFFRWLAAASGVALLEPGLALGSAPVDRTEDELWTWLRPNAGLHLISFDVSAERDTVLVLATESKQYAIYVAGFAAFIGSDEVLVESIVSADGDARTFMPFDLAFFKPDDASFCPFDAGTVADARNVRIRLRRMGIGRDPIRVGLGLYTQTFDLETQRQCTGYVPFQPFGDVILDHHNLGILPADRSRA